MVKVCVPGYSILGQRRVSARCPLEKHPHSSLQGWSHPSLRGYSSMSLEYPKLNTWTEANLGKFLIPLLYKGLFLLYEGFFSFLLYGGLLWDCSFLLYKGLVLLYEGLLLLYEGLFSFPSLWRYTCGIAHSFSTKVSSLFLLYGGLPVGLLIHSLRRSLPSLRRSSYGI
jgi:hypothetical protein